MTIGPNIAANNEWQMSVRLLPSDILRASGRVWDWMESRTQTVQIVILAAAIMTLPYALAVGAFLWSVSTFLSLALYLGVSSWEWWRVHKGGSPRWNWLFERRLVCLFVVGYAALMVVAASPYSFTLPVFALAFTEAVLRRPVPDDEKGGNWYTHNSIREGLVTAEILKPFAPDGSLWTIGYRGKVQRDGVNEWVTIVLPGGYIAADVEKKQERLAGAFGFNPRAFWTERDTNPDAPAGSVVLGRVLERSQKPVPSPLAGMERTDATKPLRVGTDVRGRDLLLRTIGSNTLIAGIMEYGKTVLARIILLWFLLDPRAAVVGGDGKGSTEDYESASELADSGLWVWGFDEDAPAKMVELLDKVRQLCNYRNQHSKQKPSDGWRPLLVHLEELQEIRAAGTDAEQKEIDKLIARCIRLGRSANVHILISTQRPSALDIPTAIRNLIGQMFALRIRSEDSRMVFGEKPPGIPMPSKPGETIYVTDKGIFPGQIDYLSTVEFDKGCKRAKAIREANPFESVFAVLEGGVSLVKRDELGEAFTCILETGPKTATQVWESLPSGIRPKDAQATGRELSKRAGFAPCRVGPKGNPGWCIEPSEPLPHAQSGPLANLRTPGKALP